MKKIALVTDSTSDLSQDYVEKNHIHVLPLKVVYRDREYVDRVEIQPEQVYRRLAEEVPSTSMPSMGEAIDLFQRLFQEGYEEILAIHISSGLSGTANTVTMAAGQFPEGKIAVVDSLSISMGTGLLVQEAAGLIDQEYELAEIVQRIVQIRGRLKVVFVVETLEYLRRGGRIGHVAATMGSLLNLKPVISVDEEGRYYTLAKVRGRKQSLQKIVELVKAAADQHPLQLIVMHADALVEAEFVVEGIRQATGSEEIPIGEVGPVVGVHTGPGLLGVAFFPRA